MSGNDSLTLFIAMFAYSLLSQTLFVTVKYVALPTIANLLPNLISQLKLIKYKYKS